MTYQVSQLCSFPDHDRFRLYWVFLTCWHNTLIQTCLLSSESRQGLTPGGLIFLGASLWLSSYYNNKNTLQSKIERRVLQVWAPWLCFPLSGFIILTHQMCVKTLQSCSLQYHRSGKSEIPHAHQWGREDTQWHPYNIMLYWNCNRTNQLLVNVY